MRAAEHVPQLTPDATPIRDQIEEIATQLYGADGVGPAPGGRAATSRGSRSSGWRRRRCAWPRRICRCRTIRCSSTGPPASGCRSAASCRAPARGSSSCSAATCSACRDSAGRPLHERRHRRARADRRPVLTAGGSHRQRDRPLDPDPIAARDRRSRSKSKIPTSPAASQTAAHPGQTHRDSALGSASRGGAQVCSGIGPSDRAESHVCDSARIPRCAGRREEERSRDQARGRRRSGS